MSGFSDLQSAARAFTAAAAPSPKKSKRRYTPPFSLRFTVEERRRLDEMAGNQPLGSYIRDRLLGEQTEKRRKTRKPAPDTALLALVLKSSEYLISNSRLAFATQHGFQRCLLQQAPDWTHWICKVQYILAGRIVPAFHI